MKKIILILFLESFFQSTINAAQTVTPGIYRFPSCGGIGRGEFAAPGVEREYQDRFLCKDAYEGYGPAQCKAAAELYAQELSAKSAQNYQACASNLEGWEKACKQFIRQAAKQCESLKTTEQLQEEENQGSQNKQSSAKNKFNSLSSSENSSPKDKFANYADENQAVNRSENDVRLTIEKVRQQTTAKWQQAQQQTNQEKRRLELEHERAELLQRQQAVANSKASGANSSSEALSTFGSVLMGVVQGAAAVSAGQTMMRRHSENGRSGSSGQHNSNRGGPTCDDSCPAGQQCGCR
jgi:hypothetical protein